MSLDYSEDNLVEKAASDILFNLGWKLKKLGIMKHLARWVY